MSRHALGEFEHQILLVLAGLGGESYSVPILGALEQSTGKTVAPAAIYIGLRRLETRGLLSSELRTDDATSRQRRYFKLQPVAIQRLRDARRTFFRLWKGLEPLLEDAP